MAQDALAVPCPADTWVKVATGVVQGSIYRTNSRPVYIQDVKVTGEAAPTDNSNAAPIFENVDVEIIGSDATIDVYVMAIRYDGAVTVHL